ncbi:GntR family transcriptional regulator [Sulfitobacter sp. JB4-11]|uniref:GntR family transcriptional regulator n=1 Tax=Sulfitobacter rhodophyticola TaxID=3238304 RepID=UPI0035115A86
MPFKSLSQPRVRLADQVYDQIMQAIRTGAISVNDRIVQEKLAEEFEISRTPVREALFRMEQEGILMVAGRGGFQIRKLGEGEIAELYGSRAAIEGYAARILADRNDPQICADLRELITRTEDISEPSVHAYFKANMNVHRSFVEATKNRFLLEFFDNIWNRGSSFTLFASIKNVDLSESLGGHLALVDAIETGDGSTAAEKMIAHIQDGKEMQLKGMDLD